MCVFIDANILFSAAYKDASRLRALWDIPGVSLVTSERALIEARRNLLRSHPNREAALEDLASCLEIVGEPSAHQDLPIQVKLPPGDLAILASAIQSRSDILLTGDAKHFGHLYGSNVGGVVVMRARSFIAQTSG